MARKSKAGLVRLEALRAYDLQQQGDVFLHEAGARAESLVTAGFARVVDDGASEAGPGAVGPGDPEREPEDTTEHSTEGAEPSPDFGAGGYGSSES